MQSKLLTFLLISGSKAFVPHATRHFCMKSQVWLTRDAEQKFCKVHPKAIGIDEAGRGPLAGPVVTAACYITNGVFIEGINDSKQTKEEEREAMYEVLTKHPEVHWAATVVSHTEIDEVNILQATMNGMRRSTVELLQKLEQQKLKGSYIALVDGNRVPTEMPIDSQYVIKGDSLIFSIAAASIIAKVTRDRIMLQLDKEFPQYNLAQHKGYPTFEHRSLLMKHGPCRIHRVSYAPVRLALQAQSDRSAGAAAAPVTSSEGSQEQEPATGKRKRVSKTDKQVVAAAVTGSKSRAAAKKASAHQLAVAPPAAADKKITVKNTTPKKAAASKGKASVETVVSEKTAVTKRTTKKIKAELAPIAEPIVVKRRTAAKATKVVVTVEPEFSEPVSAAKKGKRAKKEVPVEQLVSVRSTRSSRASPL